MNNTSISQSLPLFGDRAEKELVISVTLPEYQPNIVKIMKCSLCPIVTDSRIDGSVISVSGKVEGDIIYLSDFEGKVKSIHIDEDFSHDFKMPDAASENALLSVSADVSNVATKLLSPRQLDTKCRINIGANVTENTQKELYSPESAKNDGAFVKTTTLPFSVRTPLALYSDTLQGDIQLSDDQKNISEIIFTDAVAFFERTSVSEGEVHFKGVMNICCVYCAQGTGDEMSEYVTITTTLPFEASISDESITKDSHIFANITPFCPKASVSYDNYGENRIISLNIPYTVNAYVYNDNSLCICTDVFGTQGDITPQMCSFTTEKTLGVINTTAEFTEKLRTDSKALSQIDGGIFTAKPLGTEISEGKYFVLARINGTLFGKDQNSYLVISDVSFNTKVPIDGITPLPDTYAEVSLNTRDFSLSHENGAVICNMTLGIDAVVSQKSKSDCIETVSITSEQNKSTGKAQIIVYYPDANEDIWSIAKHFRVDPKILSDSNAPNQSFLIIPKKS